MSKAPAISGETCQYEWSPEAACMPKANPKNTTTVTSGVTNRPGNHAPAANPIAVSAGTPAALTTAGHHGDAGQAADLRPGGGGGPGSQLTGPARPGRARDQVGDAPTALT